MTPEELHTILAAARGQDAEGIVEHLAATVEGPVRDDLAILAVRLEPTRMKPLRADGWMTSD